MVLPNCLLSRSPEHAVVVHDQVLVYLGGGVAAGKGAEKEREASRAHGVVMSSHGVDICRRDRSETEQAALRRLRPWCIINTNSM
jgi:hypothetical protein